MKKTRQERKFANRRGIEWLRERNIDPVTWTNRHNPQYRRKGKRYVV